ncbi:MAG TPA: hypothetical protein VG425_04015 [Casimicrobiaceae bacterium]|jgi:hypothetical protein|nr:hypothetical protein [Casimicrobiaceae bacterium]
MLSKSFSSMTGVVTSLKVAALVSVLGAVVLAAEHRLEVAHEPTIARPTVTSPESKAERGAEQAPADYFPAHFPPPSGPVAEQPSTF